MRGHRTGKWIVGLAAGAAAMLLLAGAASACQVPATAEVACAADKHHWEATVTVTNEAPVAWTLTAAGLDTTAWSTEAALTGMTPGTVLRPGGTMTARATGIPLSTAGATITYTGRYADGLVETATFTLGRPMLSCDEETTTTTAATTTTTAATTTTTVAATTTTTAAPTTTTTLAPMSIPGSVVTTSTVPTEVLGESESTTSQPILARTGAGAAGPLALGALVLVLTGSLLVWAGRPRRTIPA